MSPAEWRDIEGARLKDREPVGCRWVLMVWASDAPEPVYLSTSDDPDVHQGGTAAREIAAQMRFCARGLAGGA